MKARTLLSQLTYGLINNKTPVKYVATSDTWGSYNTPQTGVSSEADAAQSVGTLWQIIDLLSTSTAAVNWHMYRINRDGRRVYGAAEDERTEVITHPALNLLNNPNPFMTRNELVQRTQQFLDLIGDAFWLVEYRGRMPIGLWPIIPTLMEERRDPEEFLIGWWYRQPDGTRKELKLNQVIHFQVPNPSNMWRGSSVVRSILTNLEAMHFATAFNRNMFANDATPGGVLQADNPVSGPELEQLTDTWRAAHQGVGNASRVAVLANGVKWVSVTPTMRDMMFTDLINLSRDQIREAYGIHPHMLGQSSDVNRANAEAASADFARWKLVPRLDRIQQTLNKFLLPLFSGLNSPVEFSYENPVPRDAATENAERDSKVTAAVALITAGADPTETLQAFGLPTISWTQPAQPEPESDTQPAPRRLQEAA